LSLTPPSFTSILLALVLGPAAASSADAPVRAFEITASRFEFQPERIEVQEGDLVKLTLRSADTTHGIAIPELKVKIKIPRGGAPVTAEFVASPPGTYTIKCSEYCGPGHKKMLGTLVVTGRAQ